MRLRGLASFGILLVIIGRRRERAEILIGPFHFAVGVVDRQREFAQALWTLDFIVNRVQPLPGSLRADRALHLEPDCKDFSLGIPLHTAMKVVRHRVRFVDFRHHGEELLGKDMAAFAGKRFEMVTASVVEFVQ
jgi:hypothetical protein